MDKKRLQPSFDWTPEPARPEWLENFAALHSVTIQWSLVQSHWTLMRPAGVDSIFYVEIVHSGMEFEDFKELLARNPVP